MVVLIFYLIGLTVFKLIIKGKDSNMKRKVGQRRNSFIAINFVTPKGKFTLSSRGKHSDNRKANYGIIEPWFRPKKGWFKPFLAIFSHFRPLNQPLL